MLNSTDDVINFIEKYINEKENINLKELFKKINLSDKVKQENSFLFAKNNIETVITNKDKEDIVVYLLLEIIQEKGYILVSFEENIFKIIKNKNDIDFYNYLKYYYIEKKDLNNYFIGEIKIIIEAEEVKDLISILQPTLEFRNKILNTKDSANNFYIIIVKELKELSKGKYENIDITSEIRRLNLKIYKERVEDINSIKKNITKMEETLSTKIKNSEKGLIEIIGIFVSIFTLISVNTQFFKEAVDDKKAVEIIFLLFGINIITILAITFLLLFIRYMFEPIEKISYYLKYYFISLFIIIFIIFIGFIFYEKIFILFLV